MKKTTACTECWKSFEQGYELCPVCLSETIPLENGYLPEKPVVGTIMYPSLGFKGVMIVVVITLADESETKSASVPKSAFFPGVGTLPCRSFPDQPDFGMEGNGLEAQRAREKAFLKAIDQELEEMELENQKIQDDAFDEYYEKEWKDYVDEYYRRELNRLAHRDNWGNW